MTAERTWTRSIQQRRRRSVAPPGPLRWRKSEPGCTSGFCIPVPDEIESAHLLANEARERLRQDRLDDQTILELADDFVAEDRGEDVDEFVEWARYTTRLRRRRPRTPRSLGAQADLG